MMNEIDRMEYEVLLEQRQQIVRNILETAKSFHQVFIAIVTFFSAALSILLTVTLSNMLFLYCFKYYSCFYYF